MTLKEAGVKWNKTDQTQIAPVLIFLHYFTSHRERKVIQFRLTCDSLKTYARPMTDNGAK